jgi:hypothetical protein
MASTRQEPVAGEEQGAGTGPHVMVQFVLVQIFWTSRSTVCMLNITLSVWISFSQFAALEDRKE